MGDCIGDGKTYLLKPDQLGLHVLERERKRQRQRERERAQERWFTPCFAASRCPLSISGLMDVLDLSCTSVVAKISSFAITLQAAPEAAALESYV